MPSNKDTITAIATPPGRSGIAVIRISGKKSVKIYKSLTGEPPVNRQAKYTSFTSSSKRLLDKGVSIFFKGPASYTGEDTVECYSHGNRMILDMLLEEIISLGARLALPGEFTERAFLNDKIDLVQAEAVADLIDSNSKKAVRSAMQSLQGAFSENILQLREKTVHAKALIEAYLDFPDEEDVNIDVSPAKEKINECLESLNNTLLKAKRGRMLNHAPLIVLAGPPNAGKSTLINYLSGSDTSIVSEHPGTTRDAIRESILLSDQLVTLVDTAGLRSTNDEVEKEGVERTYKAIHSADLVLYIFDSRDTGNPKTEIKKYLSDEINYMLIRNKIDLCDKKSNRNIKTLDISAKTGEGVDELVKKIKQILDFATEDEDIIFARQRHVDAIKRIRSLLKESLSCIEKRAGLEIVAEPLRQSLLIFDEIIGKTTTNDILENIFSRFCIGK